MGYAFIHGTTFYQALPRTLPDSVSRTGRAGVGLELHWQLCLRCMIFWRFCDRYLLPALKTSAYSFCDSFKNFLHQGKRKISATGQVKLYLIAGNGTNRRFANFSDTVSGIRKNESVNEAKS